MDFYVDLAVAVVLRLLKDKVAVKRYYPALAKVFIAIRDFADSDKGLEQEIIKRDTRQ